MPSQIIISPRTKTPHDLHRVHSDHPRCAAHPHRPCLEDRIPPLYPPLPGLDERAAGSPVFRRCERTHAKDDRAPRSQARDERAGRGLRPGAAHYPDRSARWARGRSDGNGSAGGDAAGGGGTGPCCKPHQHPVPLGPVSGKESFERGRFDRAVLVTVLGEIPGREAALREIFEALRPGGILLVEETIRDPHFQTRSTVTRLAGVPDLSGRNFPGIASPIFLPGKSHQAPETGTAGVVMMRDCSIPAFPGFSL